MKYVYIIVLTLLLSITEGYSQKKMTISGAVNIADRQRMLSQRMAKNKVYMKAGKNSKNAEKELEDAIDAFNDGINKLTLFAPTDLIKYKVQLQKHAFKSYQEEILDRSKKSMEEIIDTNTLFLAICDDVVSELVKYAMEKSAENSSKNEEYVLTKITEATEASGKLRYLTQRLAFYFALNSYEIQRVAPSAIDAIIKELDRNINYLIVLEFNTLDIDDALSQLQYNWYNLKESLYKDEQVQLNPQDINAVDVYNTCNIILQTANTVTRMYAELNNS